MNLTEVSTESDIESSDEEDSDSNIYTLKIWLIFINFFISFNEFNNKCGKKNTGKYMESYYCSKYGDCCGMLNACCSSEKGCQYEFGEGFHLKLH